MVVAYALPVEVMKDSVSSSFREAKLTSESELWRNAMVEKIESLHMNDTWELTVLPQKKKAIGCKQICAKDGPPGGTVRYKARLVVKGYAQRDDIDYNKVFSPVMKHSPIRILLALVAQ